MEFNFGLGIDKDARHVVLMCGSMGCGPIPKMIDELKAEETKA